MTTKKTFVILLSFMFVFQSACQAPQEMEEAPKAYLQELIALVKNNSVNKNEIDWERFEKELFEKGKGAKTVADVYPVAAYAIEALGDNHSYYMPAVPQAASEHQDELPVLEDAVTPEDIAYVRLPFCMGDEQYCQQYIEKVQAKITQEKAKFPKGWVIDLRGNFGGNMWPMLLASEPFLGAGTHGYFVNAANQSEAWKMHEGRVYIDTTFIFENANFSNLEVSGASIAVLIDDATASSGEAMAVAFKNRSNVRFFGMPTYGVSTGCVAHTLSDGSVVNLAETVFADHKMQLYGGEIAPDVKVSSDEALAAAIAWIDKNGIE